MGKWPLEVAKMCCYMAFPVSCFHYFNQPENFESFVTKVRREMLQEDTPEQRKQLSDFIEEMNRHKRLKEIETMEASDKKFKELRAQQNVA